MPGPCSARWAGSHHRSSPTPRGASRSPLVRRNCSHTHAPWPRSAQRAQNRPQEFLAFAYRYDTAHHVPRGEEMAIQLRTYGELYLAPDRLGVAADARIAFEVACAVGRTRRADPAAHQLAEKRLRALSFDAPTIDGRVDRLMVPVRSAN